ncbi:septation protein SpoVG family protein [bacterium]|nr:septation protein SpoVG family protein [bacterium]
MKKMFFGIAIVSIILMLVSCAKKEEENIVERKFNKKTETVQNNVSNMTKAEIIQKESVKDDEANTAETTVVKEKVQIEKADTTSVKAEVIVKKVFKTYISSITKNGDNYSVILDNSILINNVKIEDNKLVFPYNESNGKNYYFIWCNDKYLLGKIKKDIINNKIKTSTAKPKITKIVIKKLDKGALQGFAEVEFDSEFSIKSIPIFIGGKYGDNIGNPSVKIDGKYVTMVKIIDKEWKKIIQKKVLEKFYQD